MGRVAPRKERLTGADYIDIRVQLNMNQAEFWAPIGITQSGGSRYEGGRNVPEAVEKLVLLVYVIGLTPRQIKALDES